MTDRNLYPYPPRPGTNLEFLDADSESHSTNLGEGLSDVIEFEHGLYNADLDPNSFPGTESYRLQLASNGESLSPLKDVWETNINSTSLAVSYFMTPEGVNTLDEATGVRIEAETLEECASILCQLDVSNIKSSILDKLESDSVGYEEQLLTDIFIANGYSGEALPEPNIVTVYKNPESILEKATGYKKLKKYLVCVTADLERLGEDDDGQLKAKLLITELYKKRINYFLADMYVSAYKLLRQNQLSGINIHEEVINELEEVLPAFSSQKNKLGIVNFLQRMDRFTNGVSKDSDGKFTWLSPEAAALGDQTPIVGRKVEDRGIYSELDPDLLNNTEVNAETFGSWLRTVLSEYYLLSEYSDWDSERTGPAKDDKWQVIVNDKFKSLSVNGKQKVMKVSAKNISITDAVADANHEVTHVEQNENMDVIVNLSILEQIGIDAVREQTEAGGIWQEKIAKEALSGVVDRDNGTGYLKALRIKASGGTFGECAQVYFEDLVIFNPNKDPRKLAAQAINRAKRLYRSGGMEYAQTTNYLTNTQPLNYLEQKLIYDNLSEEKRKYLFLKGVTIYNLERMIEAGLADVSKISIPERKPWEILLPLVKEALSKQ